MAWLDDLKVVVEGRADAVLLARLVARALSLEPEFFVGARQLSLVTLARNILVHEGGPVLLVMDADTTNPEVVAESRALTEVALRNVALNQDFTVFAFVPQIEVAFFEAYEVLQRHFGPGELIGASQEIGRLDPRRTLQALLVRHGTTPEAFYHSLDEADVDALLAGAQAGQLMAALGSWPAAQAA